MAAVIENSPKNPATSEPRTDGDGVSRVAVTVSPAVAVPSMVTESPASTEDGLIDTASWVYPRQP